MISKAIHTTYDGQSFYKTDPIDIAPTTEYIIYVDEILNLKPIDVIDYFW